MTDDLQRSRRLRVRTFSPRSRPRRSGRSWTVPQRSKADQITPRALIDAISDPDRAAAKRAFEAMMKMRKIGIAAIEAARRG